MNAAELLQLIDPSVRLDGLSVDQAERELRLALSVLTQPSPEMRVDRAPRPGLVKKIITNKRGVRTTVWIRPEDQHSYNRWLAGAAVAGVAATGLAVGLAAKRSTPAVSPTPILSTPPPPAPTNNRRAAVIYQIADEKLWAKGLQNFQAKITQIED